MVKNFPAIGLDKRAEEFVGHFKDRIPLGARVLDIGGGWGFYVEPLERLRQCEVTVLDVVQPGFQKAPVVVYSGETMPFPDGFFDISLLVTMLHHVPDPEKILREARRVTRRFVIVIEDLYRTSWGRWWTILRDQIYNFEFVGHPCQFKKKEEWFQCFQKLGFGLESEKETYTSLLGMRILNGIFVLRV
jgi:ubiquinone/menaquinone biosynthesis C-methylase UbiE